MDDKIIIETFVKAIQDGTMTLDMIPVDYRDEVAKKLGDGE